MYSPRSNQPWVVRIVESCWNLVNLCLLTFQRWQEDLGIPRRSWLTDGNPRCGRATATNLVRTDEGVVHARMTTRRAQLVRRTPSCSCRNTTEAEVDDSGHPSCSRTSRSLLFKHQKNPKTRRRNPKQNQRNTKKCRRSCWKER